MRFGAPVFGSPADPELWAAEHLRLGYNAAYCPVKADATDSEVQGYATAARRADILIAEVGAWSNPLSPDSEVSSKAIAYCQQQLELAERIGANCCVNISGSCGAQWDGPDAKNLTPETFDRIVEISRKIIDAVKPKRTFFTLETMPCAYPNTVDSYVRLLYAINRSQFAVHFDPVNIITSPETYYRNDQLLIDCFRQLGKHIKSCHAKDILLSPNLTVHLDETRPGLGNLDYRTFLSQVNQTNAEIPIMLEHLPDAESYLLAADYVRSVANEMALDFPKPKGASNVD